MNPSIMAREGPVDFIANLTAIAAMPFEEILAQVFRQHADGIVEEGLRLAEIVGERMRVKIPPTPDGIRAVKRLKDHGVRCAVTGANTLAGCLLGARAGADWVIPYLGYTDTYDPSAADLPRQVKQVFGHFGFTTRLMLAVRTPRQAMDGALAGAHACTMGYDVLRELYLDLTTERRTADFLEQWRKVNPDRDWLTG
jgi:TalC/MipB family fructose-6-phosphate aldolase